MIDKIDNNQIQNLLGKSSPEQVDSDKPSVNSGEDVTLQVDYASLLNKAAQIPQTDTKDIQQAQELLKSGQLESSQNVQEASKDMIEFGV